MSVEIDSMISELQFHILYKKYSLVLKQTIVLTFFRVTKVVADHESEFSG